MLNQNNCKMKRFLYAVMLLLGLSMIISCGQQQTKNNNVTENQIVENEDHSDDEYDDEIIEETTAPEVDPNGYKWLEGVWMGEDEETHEFVKMIITDTYFQYVRGITDFTTDKVEDQSKQELNIARRYNVSHGKEILSINEDFDWIGIDVERRCPFFLLCEFCPDLYLKKSKDRPQRSQLQR